MHIIRPQDMLHLKIIKTFDKTTQVILIIMRGDHIIDRIYLLILEILYYLICMRTISSVIEKILPCRLYKNRKSLTHINKMHRHISLSCSLHRSHTSRKQKGTYKNQ